MAGTSSKTELVTLRLPIETMDLVRKRVAKTGDKVSGYLAKILVLQVSRKR